MSQQQLRLMTKAAMQAESGDLRSACDTFLAATLSAPSVWSKNRFNCFMKHTMILRELHFKASPQDIKTLRKKFLRNEEEPPHFRVEASFALGILESNRGDRARAADMYREGLAIAHAVTAVDRARIVESDLGEPLTVGYLVDTLKTESLESNLSCLEGRGPTVTGPPCERDFGDRSHMPPISNGVSITTGSIVSGDDMAAVMKRAAVVGGGACDKCGKTLEQLGKEKLDCCGRCKLMYYCSIECQHTAWKAGHKKACRKPNQIVVGDYMMLTGLVNKAHLNGSIVCVLEQKNGRWVVRSSSLQTISVAPDNLRHIRPAK